MFVVAQTPILCLNSVNSRIVRPLLYMIKIIHVFFRKYVILDTSMRNKEDSKAVGLYRSLH